MPVPNRGLLGAMSGTPALLTLFTRGFSHTIESALRLAHNTDLRPLDLSFPVVWCIIAVCADIEAQRAWGAAMRVVLVRDVPDLGMAGEVKNVADGFARNYLIPRGMAAPASTGALREAVLKRQIDSRQEVHIEQQNRDLSAALEGLSVTFEVRAGEKDQLYGSITNADIAAALEAQVGRRVDRRKIELEKPIRHLGTYEVRVRLSEHVVPSVEVVLQRQEE